MSQNSTNSNPVRCPECGGELPAEAPRGLCPQCLLLAVAAPTEPGIDPTKAGPRRRAPAPAPALPAVAAAFPQLEILELIGQGGMGAVYKARQPRLNRFVALKILPESLGLNAAFAERFAREGQLLARLNHPNIVHVHDFGQAGGFYYLLMEYVDGVNLRQAMKAGRFSSAQALAIVPKICEALQFAHDEGVLHRDVKPENILIDARGRVKLVDFGIAKLVGESEAPSEPNGGSDRESIPTLTHSGAALGTPNYMAPEQIAQPASVDHRADIYSLGVVFYELLTGELPKGGFVRPSERTPVGAEVDAIVLRALENERGRRQQSAAELKTQVESITTVGPAETGLTAPPVIASEELAGASSISRWQRPLLAVGGAVLAVIVLLVWVRAHRTSSTNFTAPVRDPVEGAAMAAPPASPQFILELDRGWVHSNANAIIVMSQSGVEPGQEVRAMTRLPDGRVASAGSTVSILNRGGRSTTSLSFSWSFPASFSQAQQDATWETIRARHIRRPLRLTMGEPFEIFSTTNDAGGVVTGWLDYGVSPDDAEGNASNNSTPARTFVRLKPAAAMSGWQQMGYAAKVPPGHFLRAICRGNAADDGEAHTRFYPATPGGEGDCTWFVRGNFKPEHLGAGAEQLKLLQAGGPIEVAVGTPRRLFALTNDIGETFEGWLELVGPTRHLGAGQFDRSKPARITSGFRATGISVVLTGATNEIRGEQNEIRTISVRTETQLLPGEQLIALRRNPDGRTEPASVSFSVRRRRDVFSTTTFLTWFVPDSFSTALMEQAVGTIRREFSDRPLRVGGGEIRPLFSITNSAGGILAGLMQFQREVPIVSSTADGGAGDPRPEVKAIVRLRPQSRHGLLFYAATVPPGYRLEATVGGSEPVEGDSHTSMALSGQAPDYHCSWRAPAAFKPDELQLADQQVQELALRGPLGVSLGKPQRVFAVTNRAGEVFEGRFELFGPASTAGGATSPLPPVMNPASSLPAMTDLRRLALDIARGDSAAFGKWQRMAEDLYRGIDYKKDEARMTTNLVIMSAVVEVLGAEVAAGSPDALDAVRRSLSIPHLKSFAPKALGLAAAAGHEESLEMLLDHRRWGILLSSAVSALSGAAARNDERAVEFLVDVLSDPKNRPLWHLASQGLGPAANAGNVRAAAALKLYQAGQAADGGVPPSRPIR